MISVKTQNDEIEVSCSVNQQNVVTLHVKPVPVAVAVKHDHQYGKNFKFLNIIWCIVCFFCIYWDAWFFVSRNMSSVIRVECKALWVWDCLRFTPFYVIYTHNNSNVKTPSDVT